MFCGCSQITRPQDGVRIFSAFSTLFMRAYSIRPKPLCFLSLLFLLTACTKKDIQFGNEPGESYSKLVQVDTVSVRFSTYLTDSFATNGIADFIAGSYADSLLGTTRAKAYVQLMPTLAETIEDGAVFDSLCFVLKLNGYSYGDTTKPQTVSIRELNEALAYTYGSSIYNTSSFAEASVPLGTKTVIVRPHLTDSVVVRLDDAKGREFFSKMQYGAAEMQTADAFLTYFKGVSINFSSPTPSAVYGFEKSDSTIVVRMYYHTSIPYPETKWKDFTYYSNLSANRIVTDRSGTPLASLTSGGELPSTITGNRSFTQAGTGAVTKLTFPALRSVLQLDPTVKLLKATLVLKVLPQSYSDATPLPSSLLFYQTDETNTFGAPLYHAGVTAYLTASPSVDAIYDGVTTYSFDVTSSINANLTTGGTENLGLFLTAFLPGASGKIDRAVLADQAAGSASSRLTLSLLTVKN